MTITTSENTTITTIQGRVCGRSLTVRRLKSSIAYQPLKVLKKKKKSKRKKRLKLKDVSKNIKLRCQNLISNKERHWRNFTLSTIRLSSRTRWHALRLRRRILSKI